MNTDDPKFTAHLLGELDDITPAERAEIETLLRADAHAAAEAAETQALAELLRRDLQGEESPPLTAAQRASVLAALAPGARVAAAKIVPFPRRFTVLSAIAACLIVGVSIVLIFHVMEEDKAAAQRSVATREAPSGMTIALEPSPAPPAKSAPVAPEVTEAGLQPVDPTPPAKGTDRLAQGKQEQQFRLPEKKTTNPQPPPAEPVEVGDGERKITTVAPLDGASAGADTGAGGSALKKPLPKKGDAGKGEKAPPPKEDQLVLSNADRSEALRDYRQRAVGASARPGAPLPSSDPASTAALDAITENPFLTVREHPLSTFGIAVDTASYALVRRFLHEQKLPPKSAVRIEELLNSFTYDYPPPKGDAPFSATMEVASCPWAPAHRLVRIGLKGREIAQDKRAIIAQDVKIQVEFNPAQVASYRLIGSEKRLLAKEDSHDDQKRAGEVRAGHTVTALYEIVPAGKDTPKAAALKYQKPAAQKTAASSELLTLKLRSQAPGSDVSKLLEFPLTDTGAAWEKSSRDFRFAAAVAGCGLLLRDSPHKGAATWSSIRKLAVEGQGPDRTGDRAEFISLIEKAQALLR